MAVSSPADVRIDLLDTVRLLHETLTESLCQTVWLRNQKRERAREWTLYALGRFWTTAVLRGPVSLTHALEDSRKGSDADWPVVEASVQAFFQRCQTLAPRFFAELFGDFTERLLVHSEPVFVSWAAALRERFAEVWALDGSRLDAIAHRLKKLRDVRSVVLPGCLLAGYDLFRGVLRLLHFDPDAASSEFGRAIVALGKVPRESLVLADRLYPMPAFFAELGERGVFGLFRRNARVTLTKVECLQKADGELAGWPSKLEDWLVDAGTGATAPRCRLRYLRLRCGRKTYELLTNVLDPARLGAAEAFALYRERWTIERTFLDLKQTLNLHRFYSANPNAVAMQVYAGAMVYNAMRVAQGRIAKSIPIEPERISTAKLFPKIARASAWSAGADFGVLRVQMLNPGVHLTLPDFHGEPSVTTTLGAILVEKRNGRRRKRRFSKNRARWIALPRALQS